MPETSTAAKRMLQEELEQWQPLSDGSGEGVVRTMDLPQGKERSFIVRTHDQVQATQKQIEKTVQKTQQEWEKRLWHLSKHPFTCETDARTALEKTLKGRPSCRESPSPSANRGSGSISSGDALPAMVSPS